MIFFFFNKNIYDYLSFALIEGLIERGNIVKTYNQTSFNTQLKLNQIKEFIISSDYVIISSNIDSNIIKKYHSILENKKLIYLDGEDYFEIFLPKNVKFHIIFKREFFYYLRFFYPKKTFPLPLSAHKSYVSSYEINKDIFLSYLVNLETNSLRKKVFNTISKLKFINIVNGSTGERAYSEHTISPIPTPNYSILLERSEISINVPGGGQDCARYWEILSSRCMLMTYKLDTYIPFKLINGKDCIEFKSSNDLIKKINYLNKNMSKVHDIAKNGFLKLISFHTSERRVKYFERILFSQRLTSKLIDHKDFFILNIIFKTKIIKIYHRIKKSLF